jgi:type IV secretory pathway VirB10-like protein
MNIPPTITIRPGFRLNIELTTDVTQLIRAVVTGF